MEKSEAELFSDENSETKWVRPKNPIDIYRRYEFDPFTKY